MSYENKCTTDTIYPCMCSHQICELCMSQCTHSTFWGSQNCHECLWMCLPCTIVFDILTLVPFTGICICKKTCCKKTTNIEQTITTQPY